MAKGLTETEQEVVDGLLLSDGCLTHHNYANIRLSFTQKEISFTTAIKNALPSLSWAPTKITDRFDVRTNNTYHSVKLRSHVHPYLRAQLSRWYPSSTKVAPSDIRITPTTLLWWYLGDGHLEKKKSRPRYRRVCLSTNSFGSKDISRLILSLSECLETTNSIYEEQGRIMIGRDAMCSFAKRIGSNPVQAYDYKFDFGQYVDPLYLAESYKTRPLAKINKYRRQNQVREFDLSLLELEV